jgi:uncharacterized membrane protein
VGTSELALTQGLRDTRGALERWNARPGPVLRGWLGRAFAFALALLAATLVVASVVTPDPTPAFIPGLAYPADAGDYGHVLWRNGLVLALHAVACVAGFIAGSSLPLQASRMEGWRRWVHEKARPAAFAWVVAVTGFSLVTQAYILGSTGAQLANQFDISPALLIATVLPHALPELVAVFLPLAAWTIASRRGEWQDLLAATFATVAIAIPILLLAATWETWVWPRLLDAASSLVTAPSF